MVDFKWSVSGKRVYAGISSRGKSLCNYRSSWKLRNDIYYTWKSKIVKSKSRNRCRFYLWGNHRGGREEMKERLDVLLVKRDKDWQEKYQEKRRKQSLCQAVFM